MTCVAAVKTETGIVMVGDSLGVCLGTGFTVERRDPKVFVKGPYLIGFTSSFRMGQALRYGITLPPLPRDPFDPFEFMATKFIDAVRDGLKTAGFRRVENEVQTGGTFLVGLIADGKPRLFEIDDDFQVAESMWEYSAVGCAREIALGVLCGIAKVEFSRDVPVGVKEALTWAMETAERFSAYVRRPFTFASIDREEPKP